MASKRMKLILQLGFLSAANIGFAFISQWYVLTQLGPGIETDALFAGMTIPQLALVIVSGSLMHVLVPLLSGKEEQELRHDAWGFLVLVGGLFAFLAIVLYLTAPWWVPLSVPGFSETGRELTIMLTRIQLVGMVFSAINGVQWAAYHARQCFLWAEFTPLLVSAFTLLLLIWALPRFGIIAAAWMNTLRIGLQTLLLAPGMGYPVCPNLRSFTLQQAWQRIKPLLLGAAYYKTDPVVDRFLLSTAATGSLSLYYLAQQIYSAVNQVVNKAIAAPLVPVLSRLHQANNMADFRRAYYRKLIQLGILSLIGLLGLFFFGQSLLKLLIGHGSVTTNNIIEIWWIMIWLGGTFAGGVLGSISSSSFYAMGDTSTPTRLSIYSYTLFIPIKIMLFYVYGITGIALAASLFFMVNFILQVYLMEKKYLYSFPRIL